MPVNWSAQPLSLICFFLLLGCNPIPVKHKATDKMERTANDTDLVSPDPMPAKMETMDTLGLFDYNYAWLENENDSVKLALAEEIPPPPGFFRKPRPAASFGGWLRNLPLKPSGTKVYLFNGEEKGRQDVHARVVDVDPGKRDLQQCADAVMRLRAEFLFAKNDWDNIHFNFTSGQRFDYNKWRSGKRPVFNGDNVTFVKKAKPDASYKSFRKYMNIIFAYAGTASLEKELHTVTPVNMEIGDVFIQGGYPGHAVLVVDMAENMDGEKVFLLAQSYMPAQDLHILNNFEDHSLNPWYKLQPDNSLFTPEWTFSFTDLKRFVVQ